MFCAGCDQALSFFDGGAGRDGDVSGPLSTVWLRVVTHAGIQPNHDDWRFSVTDNYAIKVASILYDGAILAGIAAYRSAPSRRYVPSPARQR